MEKVKPVKLTNNKWLNLYSRKYSDGREYFFCTRRQEENIAKPSYIDAVRALPYFVDSGKIKVVLIKEYRYPIEKEIFELPAGLVEQGENPDDAIIRELEEEIGAEVVKLDCSTEGFNSPGMTDEFSKTYFVEVKLVKSQHLDKGEKIDLHIIDLDQIPEVIKDGDFCLISKALLMMFYYKNITK